MTAISLHKSYGDFEAVKSVLSTDFVNSENTTKRKKVRMIETEFPACGGRSYWEFRLNCDSDLSVKISS